MTRRGFSETFSLNEVPNPNAADWPLLDFKEKACLVFDVRRGISMSRQIFFDTDKLAVELRISEYDYDGLKSSIREEFPDDEMMYQLHLLRALRALAKRSPNTVTER